LVSVSAKAQAVEIDLLGENVRSSPAAGLRFAARRIKSARRRGSSQAVRVSVRNTAQSEETMKKLLLLVGVVIGFVLGSKQGRKPYERLEAQVRQLTGRPEIKGAVDAESDKAGNLTDPASGAVIKEMTGTAKGPTGSIDQAEIDAETDAALDLDLEGTFPTSDPSSSWAGPDIEPERPESGRTTESLKGIPAPGPQ
jgi:hypothetical protein